MMEKRQRPLTSEEKEQAAAYQRTLNEEDAKARAAIGKCSTSPPRRPLPPGLVTQSFFYVLPPAPWAPPDILASYGEPKEPREAKDPFGPLSRVEVSTEETTEKTKEEADGAAKELTKEKAKERGLQG